MGLILIFERLEVVVDSLDVQLEQVLLNEFQDRYADLEDVPGPIDENIVPYPHAQTQGKAVEEQGLKPLLNPKQIGNRNLREVRVQHRQFILENLIENVEILLQKRKLLFVKTSDALNLGTVLILPGGISE